eukprot:8739159-Ditylum_brightwellii.AAC.1
MILWRRSISSSVDSQTDLSAVRLDGSPDTRLSSVSGDNFRLDSIRAGAKFVISHPCDESSSIPVLDIAEEKST